MITGKKRVIQLITVCIMEKPNSLLRTRDVKTSLYIAPHFYGKPPKATTSDNSILHSTQSFHYQVEYMGILGPLVSSPLGCQRNHMGYHSRGLKSNINMWNLIIMKSRNSQIYLIISFLKIQLAQDSRLSLLPYGVNDFIPTKAALRI